MKKFLLVSALLIGMASSYSTIEAQVSLNVSINIGRQPAWGPVGYDYVDFYYFPDINCYFNVNLELFYYFERGRWFSARYLPYAFRNYDLYGMYKVVLVGVANPWIHNSIHIRDYGRYKGYKNQVIIRDSRDTRYRDSRNNKIAWYSGSKDNYSRTAVSSRSNNERRSVSANNGNERRSIAANSNERRSITANSNERRNVGANNGNERRSIAANSNERRNVTANNGNERKSVNANTRQQKPDGISQSQKKSDSNQSLSGRSSSSNNKKESTVARSSSSNNSQGSNRVASDSKSSSRNSSGSGSSERSSSRNKK